MGVIIITHDLGVVAETADDIAVMYAGRIVEAASTDTLFDAPQHPYTWGLLESIPKLTGPRDEELIPIPGRPPSLINPPSGCSFHPRCPYVREAHKKVDPQLEPVPDDPGHRVACLLAPDVRHDLWAAPPRRRGARTGAGGRQAQGRGGRMSVNAESNGAPAENLVEVRDLVKHFPITQGIIFQKKIGAVRAVDGVSFDVRRGETLGIVGETGCGKSTTAKLLLRLLDPTSGSIKFEGQEIAFVKGAQLKQLRRDVQMIFQDPYSSLNPRKTVGTIIGDPFVIHGIETNDGKRRKLVQRPDGAGGAQPRALQPLSARVLGRPAPAHRRRPRARAQAEADRRGRAGLRAGRLDPGADPQPAARPPAGAGAHDHLHRPRPLRRAPHVRPHRGDVPRVAGRAGRQRHALQPPAPPVHRRAAVGRAGRRPPPGAQQEAADPLGRRAQPDQSAAGLPVPHPLPEGAGAVLDRGAADP